MVKTKRDKPQAGSTGWRSRGSTGWSVRDLGSYGCNNYDF